MRGRGWADVIVAGAVQLTRLQLSGLRFEIRDANLARSFAAARAADAAPTTRAGAAGSALPSGRTTYRTYDEIQAELKQLVAQHPGLVRKVVFGTSYQGREISGVEIARDVDAADGRPVFFTMGVHHAREWPSAEAAMEFAQLLVQEQATPRVDSLLDTERIVILPLVNPDGFVSSRGAFDLGDTLGQEPNVTLVESIVPPGGALRLPPQELQRRDPRAAAALRAGLGRRSQPQLRQPLGRARAARRTSRRRATTARGRARSPRRGGLGLRPHHHVTTLVSIHNVAALVLRPPGVSGSGLAPDEARMKAIGDAIGTAAGYTSQFGYELYDTAGTTEDDSYAATGGYGYTVEMGPPDGNFHMPYATGVIAEWTGQNPHAAGRGGPARGHAARRRGGRHPGRPRDPARHGARGQVLRLQAHVPDAHEPVLPEGHRAAAEHRPAADLPDRREAADRPRRRLDATTIVPPGRYAWHVNQSTRPFVGAAGNVEAYELTCEDAGGAVLERRTVTIARGQDVTLNLGCAGGPDDAGRRPAPRPPLPTGGAVGPPPSVDGVSAAFAAAAKLAKPRRISSARGRKFSACTRSATRLGSAQRARAAQRACERRFGL